MSAERLERRAEELLRTAEDTQRLPTMLVHSNGGYEEVRPPTRRDLAVWLFPADACDQVTASATALFTFHATDRDRTEQTLAGYVDAETNARANQARDALKNLLTSGLQARLGAYLHTQASCLQLPHRLRNPGWRLPRAVHDRLSSRPCAAMPILLAQPDQNQPPSLAPRDPARAPRPGHTNHGHPSPDRCRCHSRHRHKPIAQPHDDDLHGRLHDLSRNFQGHGRAQPALPNMRNPHRQGRALAPPRLTRADPAPLRDALHRPPGDTALAHRRLLTRARRCLPELPKRTIA